MSDRLAIVLLWGCPAASAGAAGAKLLDLVRWSWWRVMAPIWVPALLWMTACALAVLWAYGDRLAERWFFDDD